MSKIPSIDSLHKEKNVKDEAKHEIFALVLKKCIEKIVYTNRHTDKTFIIFEVPKIMIGFPMYDMRSCILFMMSRLAQHGYIIEFIDPFYLYIDWGSNNLTTSTCSLNIIPTSNPEKLKQQTKTLLKKFPDTSKVEFVYEDTLKNSHGKIKQEDTLKNVQGKKRQDIIKTIHGKKKKKK